jgi:tetratricopeptide (TPR) repeat protein
VEKRLLGLAIAALVYVLACSREGSRPGSASGGATPAAGPGPGADAGNGPVAGASAGPDGGEGPLEVLPFIENDYPRALAEARARHLPLFIDAWAPWCHTCLSMRAYVFTDARLRPLALRFVWLSLDTERDENAPVVRRLGVHVLPTLFVIDTATEQASLAWAGSLTALELTRVLEDVQLAADRPRGEAMAMLLSGHRASAARDIAGAIDDYRAALAAAPAEWPARAEAVDALVWRLSDARRFNECVSVAAAELPRMPPGTPLADTLRSAIGCARELPARAPERERLAELVATGERLVTDMTQPLLADDRSDLYDYVIGALGDLGRRGDAKRMAAAWASFLEGEAERAPTPSARAVFDAHRLLAYTAIGEPQRAVPMLEQSEGDFPDDYNPPARLGIALLETKRYDEALAALTRALDRAYGPRKLRLWSLEADVLVAKGDAAAARDALRRALDFAATVPLTGSYPALRDAIAKRLTGLSGP